jgi:hypothetical protein
MPVLRPGCGTAKPHTPAWLFEKGRTTRDTPAGYASPSPPTPTTPSGAWHRFLARVWHATPAKRTPYKTPARRARQAWRVQCCQCIYYHSRWQNTLHCGVIDVCCTGGLHHPLRCATPKTVHRQSVSTVAACLCVMTMTMPLHPQPARRCQADMRQGGELVALAQVGVGFTQFGAADPRWKRSRFAKILHQPKQNTQHRSDCPRFGLNPNASVTLTEGYENNGYTKP